MAVCSRVLVVLLALLIGGAAWAQEPKVWLGVDVRDVSKAEADALGWDAPRGAIVARAPEPGSPAQRAGLKAGEVIISVDGMELETSAALEKAVAAKRPGAEVRLRVQAGGRVRGVTVAVVEQAKLQAADMGAAPQLMLDTGGHMSKIQGVAFTPDGKQLVSGSDDKVIRVWDWQAGKTVRTIRAQVGPGDEGKIYAMALSPDGRWLAAAGWTDPTTAKLPCCGDIRLYEFATGTLTALLKGHTSVVHSLAFSPDSKRLISGSGAGDLAAIIWDVESRKLVHRLKGHKADIYAVAFAPDGARAVTGSNDTMLRLWRVSDGGMIAEMKGHTKQIDRGVAVRSSDGMIASGDATGELRLWDGNTGRYLRTLGNQGGLVGSLKFSLDGKQLLSACGYGGCIRTQRVWDVATGKVAVAYTKHDNTVFAATMGVDGRLAATGGANGDVQIWDLKTGATSSVLAGTGLPRYAVAFSQDGRRIAWGSKSDYASHAARGPLELQLRLPSESQRLGVPEPLDEASVKGFVRARTSFGAYSLVHRSGGAFYDEATLDIKKDGETVASIVRGSSDGYGHWAYSFSPDGQTIVSGGNNGWLTTYDLQGKTVGEFVGHEAVVWAVTPSPDGRLLVSGTADQTVRLWNLKTHELIATLFYGRDGEWVMWTPQGYYTGSPGSDKIVGWQINKGPDKVADYVGADQLRQHLNRPDIVERAIVLASAEQAVREAPGTTFKLADLLAKPVPRFRIVSPQSGTTERSGRVSVKINVEATPDPVKAIRVQVNGRQLAELTPDVGAGGFRPGERTLDVPLANGRNDIRITLTNNIGDKAETLTLDHDGDGDLDRRGTLYILAIGVDRYPGLGNSCGHSGQQTCDLKYSGADARRFADAIEKRVGAGHIHVVKRVLINGAADAKDLPTAANILDAVGQLRHASETDTVIVSIAGHGINEGSNYRFLPTNVEWDGPVLRASTVVPWQILQEAVETAKGRRVLFVDTCHSGNAYNQRLGNSAYHANIIAYTAARFDQLANESAKLGHGLFTYAVVEGLEGKGGSGARRQVSTKELAEHLVKRVGELAKELKAEQEPQYFKGRDAEDYVLARW